VKEALSPKVDVVPVSTPAEVMENPLGTPLVLHRQLTQPGAEKVVAIGRACRALWQNGRVGDGEGVHRQEKGVREAGPAFRVLQCDANGKTSGGGWRRSAQDAGLRE